MQTSWLDLGLVEYRSALALQERLLASRISGQVGSVVVVQRNYPVITLGRQASPDNVLVDMDELRKLGIDLVRAGRGGDVTYHDAGQLVVSPLFHLREIGMDAHRYMNSVEEAIIALLATYGVRGVRRPGYPGVWVGDRKIASVGFALRRWITFHGFAVNVSSDLRGFQLIRPCGLEGTPMTSLELELGHPVAFEDVKARLRSVLGDLFSLDWVDLPLDHILKQEAEVGAD